MEGRKTANFKISKAKLTATKMKLFAFVPWLDFDWNHHAGDIENKMAFIHYSLFSFFLSTNANGKHFISPP